MSGNYTYNSPGVSGLLHYLASFHTVTSADEYQGRTIVTTEPIEATEESVTPGKVKVLK